MSSMRRGALRLGLCLALLCLGLIVTGCGGGASSSSSGSEAGAGAEPSAQFLKPQGKAKKGTAEKIVKFGTEASTEEREAAGAVVVKNLKARAAADFTTQCESLNLKTITSIAGAKTRGDCPAALKKVAEPLSKTKEVREDTLDGSIAALRVKGEEGYALYHGNDGKDWAVPLEKEDGSWKVGALIMIEL